MCERGGDVWSGEVTQSVRRESGSQERLYSVGNLGILTLQSVCKPIRVCVLSRHSGTPFFKSSTQEEVRGIKSL